MICFWRGACISRRHILVYSKEPDRLRDKAGWKVFNIVRFFECSSKNLYVCEKMWFWGCGWIEAVSAVILLRVLCRKVYSCFSYFSHMCLFTYFLFFSTSRVPSRSNHYLEKVGGMYTILIGTLNAPNGSPWVETCQFLCFRYLCSDPIILA